MNSSAAAAARASLDAEEEADEAAFVSRRIKGGPEIMFLLPGAKRKAAAAAAEAAAAAQATAAGEESPPSHTEELGAAAAPAAKRTRPDEAFSSGMPSGNTGAASMSRSSSAGLASDVAIAAAAAAAADAAALDAVEGPGVLRRRIIGMLSAALRDGCIADISASDALRHGHRRAPGSASAVLSAAASSSLDSQRGTIARGRDEAAVSSSATTASSSSGASTGSIAATVSMMAGLAEREMAEAAALGPAAVAALAAAVEAAVLAESREGSVPGNVYRAKVRQLATALRDAGNGELRARLIAGTLAPRELALMSSEDLAPAAMRAEIRDRAARAARAEAEAAVLTSQWVASSAACPACSKQSVEYSMLTTQRDASKADIWGGGGSGESDAYIMRCKECGHSWNTHSAF